MSYMMRYLITSILWFFSTSVMALPPGSSSVITQSELMRVITGLLVVLLIIVILSWFVKRLHGVHLGSSKGFESIGSMTLGPKEKIMMVKVGERYLLMGVGSGSVSLLCDFGDKRPDGFNTENKPSFSQILKSAVRKA